MAGMTKEDRAEYESRLASLDYWTRLSHEQALAYGITSKRDFLAFYRAKDEAAKEELEAIEAANAQAELEAAKATAWQTVTAQFAETFGAELLINFLATDPRHAFGFLQSHFKDQPLAACILYAIHESIIIANDEHGNVAASASKAWDDCFEATFSMYLDDWTMIEHSGLWKLDHEIWHEIGISIHAYDRGLPVAETTLARIIFDFWESQTLLALEDFQKNPATQWAYAELMEIAEKREIALKRLIQETHSKAKDHLSEKDS
jgi:hypothetical protein